MQINTASFLGSFLVIWGASAGITHSQDSPSFSSSQPFQFSPFSESSCLECSEPCGNTRIQLLPGVSDVITYDYRRSDDDSFLSSSYEQYDPCSWLVTAPDYNVIEVNVLATTGNSPQISVYSDVEGVNGSLLLMFELERGELGIFYANVSRIQIEAHFPDDYNDDDPGKILSAIKLTAFAKQDCDSEDFQCLSQQCVSGTRRCDGICDCLVYEDEYGCETNCSSIDQYTCPISNECIGSDLVCNGRGDCPGMFDELACGRCGDPYIDLSLIPAVNITQPIDNSVDCLWFVTASNQSLRLQVEIWNLPLVEYQVTDSQGIARVSFGNGNDPSDKRTVVRTLNDTTHPGIITFNSSTIWIILTIQSNMILTRSSVNIELTVSEYSVNDCGTNEFSCSSGLLCIHDSKICDKIADCPEFDDELDCGCGVNRFRCQQGADCVDALMLCDGRRDCSDGSDEANCEPCGVGIIHLSSSPYRLTSIGYPNDYPINTHCTWHVYTEPDYDVMVVFQDFATEEYFDCLHVSDGVKSRLPLSGSLHLVRVSSFSENVWLTFQSDFVYSYRGFDIRLEKVKTATCPDGEVACNGTTWLICIVETLVCNGREDCPGATDEIYCTDVCGLTSIDIGKDPQELLSPYYELGEYPASTHCLWFIKDSARNRIQLDIQFFRMEEYFDVLQIGIGNDSSSGHIATLTGTAKMETIVFQSTNIWLRLMTDSSVSDRGFNITLKSVDEHGDTSCSSLCGLHTEAAMCLHPYAYCDSVLDCMLGEDEHNCENVTCGPEQYLCQGKQRCIPQESICDGKVDCTPFRDDEETCDIRGRPAGCESLMVDGLLFVECKHGWNETTIHSLVKMTHFLELSDRSMATLEGGHFKRLGKLRKLSLRNNNISRIELNAFTGLTSLTSLDISENKFTELSEGIFKELTALVELAIRSVPVQFIRSNAFSGLVHLQKLVLMRSNGTADAISSSLYERATEVEDQALNDLVSLHTVYVDDHRLCCDFRSSVLPDDNQCINIQLQSPLFNCGRLMPNAVLQVFMWILGFSALIGNLVVIAWRIREDSGKGSKYVHSFLVLNLAMSDFLMGVYMVTIATVDAMKKEEYYLTATEWRKSALCKAAGVVSVLSSEASVFFITLISVDRYLCIVHPFSRVRLQERSVWVSTASIWMASLAASLIPTVLVSGESDIYGLSDVCIGLPLLTRPVSYTFTEADVPGSSLGNDTYLIPRPVGSRPSWSYSIVLFLGVNFMCFLTIAVCYVSIFVKIKRSIRRVKQHSYRDDEIKMASKMAVIVGSDCLCWMPVIILGILSQTSVIQIQPDVYAWLVVFVLPINSSLNPYLYTIVTAISRRRQANSASSLRKSSQKPDKTFNPDVPMERRADSSCWTITTPAGTPKATPTSSIYCGNFEHM